LEKMRSLQGVAAMFRGVDNKLAVATHLRDIVACGWSGADALKSASDYFPEQLLADMGPRFASDLRNLVRFKVEASDILRRKYFKSEAPWVVRVRDTRRALCRLPNCDRYSHEIVGKFVSLAVEYGLHPLKAARDLHSLVCSHTHCGGLVSNHQLRLAVTRLLECAPDLQLDVPDFASYLSKLLAAFCAPREECKKGALDWQLFRSCRLLGVGFLEGEKVCARVLSSIECDMRFLVEELISLTKPCAEGAVPSGSDLKLFRDFCSVASIQRWGGVSGIPGRPQRETGILLVDNILRVCSESGSFSQWNLASRIILVRRIFREMLRSKLICSDTLRMGFEAFEEGMPDFSLDNPKVGFFFSKVQTEFL
jgi:hypothetical protein